MTRGAEPRRADAQQNRKRILEVARNALAISPDTSLNAIAKAAGVGPGTLYRHFPNREALVLGVYRHEMQHLAELAPMLIAEHPPLTALRLWFEGLAHYGRIKHGLANVLHGAMNDGALKEAYRPLVDAIDQLLRACEGAGEISPGANSEDILLLMGFLWRVAPCAGGEARAGRLVDLVIDGLRTRTGD